MGTHNKQCVRPTTTAAQCAAELQTCGGPGLPDTPCCGDMQCERYFMGTDNKQCVAPPAPQCTEQGEICGCPGCLTETCCGGSQCLEVGGQGGKMYCVNVVETAVQAGRAFASPNATIWSP